jgi:hypothetical protein
MDGKSNRSMHLKKFIHSVDHPTLHLGEAIVLHSTLPQHLTAGEDQVVSPTIQTQCSCRQHLIRRERILLHRVSPLNAINHVLVTDSHAVYWRSATKPTMDAAANLMSVTGSHHGLGLAPAPDIQVGRRRRSSASHPPPPLIGTGQRKHYSDLGSGPGTPATPRAGILRMPSQQAEKDAVDTLLFMSSPNNSQRFPHTSQTGPSPLRADAPQRRVMFDAYPPQERRIVYPPQMPPPQQHQYGPYAAHPAR